MDLFWFLISYVMGGVAGCAILTNSLLMALYSTLVFYFVHKILFIQDVEPTG